MAGIAANPTAKPKKAHAFAFRANLRATAVSAGSVNLRTIASNMALVD
jgi:hypothetical protein